MRIDVHTHIFPPEVVQERSRFFAGEPDFRLLYDSPKAKLVSAETLLDAMDQNRVDCSVVFGFPWRDMGMAARHNDYVLEASAKYSPRLIPLGCVNPIAEGSSEEAERSLRSGARGLGELAVYGGCDEREALERYRSLIDCARSYGGVLLVHANEPVGHTYPGKTTFSLDFYYSLARLCTGVPLILAHWGGGLFFFELLKREVKEALAHVHYDTAASPFLYRPEIYPQAAKMLPEGKILFGSDYPLLSPERYFREMAEAGLSEPELQAISGGNAARLFNISS
jgi:uncharacterized protein